MIFPVFQILRPSAMSRDNSLVLTARCRFILMMHKQLIEVHDITPDTVYTITPELEQLTVLSNDSDELEIKASVLLNSLVFNRITAQFLTDVTEEPLDYEALLDLPGMTGYIVKENDDLWSIAKSHHTTSESILALNDLTEENLTVGTHLLLLKEVLV